MIPKITAVIATYNGSKTIERLLNSILQQNGINVLFTVEIIVVDDRSKDNTIQLLENFEEKVSFYQNESNSGGPNKGRNVGLSKATGDFICIVDQDDCWKLNRIETVLPYLQKAPIVSSGYSIIDSKGEVQSEDVLSKNKQDRYFSKNETFLSLLSKSKGGQNTYLGSLIFSRNLKHILFEENFGMVDYDWGLKLFEHNESIEINQSLYIRYVDGSNLSLNDNYRKIDFYFSLMSLENYEKSYPSEVKRAYHRIHGTRARYYYLVGDRKKARFYLYQSGFSIKTIAYILTTFVGFNYVRKNVKIFG